MNPQLVDVSDITGATVVSRVSAWTTTNGPELVEHLAGQAPNGDLLVFYWAPSHDWRVVNVSHKTGAQISGQVTSWMTPDGDWTVEHLAGRGTNGDLLVFYWSPRHDWQVVNVSRKTGQQVSGPVTSWVVRDGNMLVEHLAGIAPNGDLLVFYWSPAHDWQVVNVSQKTGRKLSGPVTSWTAPDGNQIVEHLAGRGSNGDLLVFYWSSAHDWQVVDVTSKTRQQIRGPLCSWTVRDGQTLVEHLAGPNDAGELMLFYWTPATDWQAVNVSAIAGVRVKGEPAAYQINRNGVLDELLVVQGENGELFQLWWNNRRDWQAIYLGEATSRTYATPPVAWIVPDGARRVEHVASAEANGHLIVCWFDSEPRHITDDLGDSAKLSRAVGARRKLVVICWDWHQPGAVAPPRAHIEDAFTNGANSMQGYFSQSSLDRMVFDLIQFLPPAGVGTNGWYQAPAPYADYSDATKLMASGFTNGHVKKWADAVWQASADFDFTTHDADGDGSLAKEELTVCILIPGVGGAAGFRRVPDGRQTPTRMPLRSNGLNAGVTIPWILEVYVVDPPPLSLLYHELNHLLFDAVDMYHSTNGLNENVYVPFTPWPFGVMSVAASNLDPLHRLKFGWTRHRLALTSGRYTCRPSVTTGEAIVLLDPSHSKLEYFVLENRRQEPNTCDAGMPDQGLAVWQIIEDPAIFSKAPTPPGVTAMYWLGTTGWDRRALRLIRPVISNPHDNARALWDGSNAATGYDLQSNDPNAAHSRLRWVDDTLDGQPSGFAIRNISGAGPVIEFDIEVPW